MDTLNLSTEENFNEFFGTKKTRKVESDTKVLLFNSFGTKEYMLVEEGSSLKRKNNFVLISEEKEVKKKVEE